MREKNFRLIHCICPGRPGAQKFPGWRGKNTSNPEARNHFPKPGIFQNKTNFLFFFVMGIFFFFEFRQLYRSKECMFRQKLCFMMTSIKI